VRRLLTLLVAVLTVTAVVTPASAAPRVRPAEVCRDAYTTTTSPITGAEIDTYVVPVRFTFGGETFVEPFSLPSWPACVSSVASAWEDGAVDGRRLTKPAYLAQCDYLVEAGFISYPYAFYGVYLAENRADCARILQGVHTGTLPLPEPPPVG
jgi:hypothetical protein